VEATAAGALGRMPRAFAIPHPGRDNPLPVRIKLVTPAPPRARTGNRITALRWSKLLRELGHRVSIEERWSSSPADLLIALHAEKSADSVRRFAREHSRAPVVVALTGTDVYGELSTSPSALRSLELASRIVVLQPLALERLPERLRPKGRAILQSAAPA
jgi:hypothetical protein